MRCFNHENDDAVGSCKHCGKGLCRACLTDLGHGLACRGVHEQAVENINTLIVRNSHVQNVAPKTWYVVPAFTAFMGLVFAGYGAFAPGGLSVFLVVLGLGFLAYAAVLLVVNRRAYKVNGTQP
jgi:hypothetical protein